jgi:hypothetical protein
MRYVIYLLLLGNLAFFGWQMRELHEQNGAVRALPAIPASARSLVTLQEMQSKQAQEPVSEPGPELEAEIEPELPESVPGPEQKTGLDPEPLEPVPEPDVLEPDEDAVVIESLTELQPPSGGAITCQTLGPIMAVAQLKSLGGKLDELGLKPRQRTTGNQQAIGYWVYLPAMERSQALVIKDKLDKRKDKEYYIGKDNFISLGTFRGKSRADIRFGQVQKLGLEAVLEPRYKKNTIHWLDIDRQTGDAIDLGAVLEEYPGIKLQEQACY